MSHIVKHKQKRKRIERALKRRENDVKAYRAKLQHLDKDSEEHSIMAYKLSVAIDNVEGCKRRLG